MHTENLSNWMHGHVFDAGNDRAERSTWLVMWITAVMMVVEVVAGWWLNSMALLADGWHMASHLVALGLAAVAYATARRYSADPRFAFGTWKVEILSGFASAILLLGIAVLMLGGSVQRIFSPQPIYYLEAIVVAVVGLSVNLMCAFILGNASHGESGHSQSDDHAGQHQHNDNQGVHRGNLQDLNLKSAFLHVVADAATSVLAILALGGGWMFGWSWLDPATAIVGALLVTLWAKGLVVETGKVLLDREMDHPIVDTIRNAVEAGAHAGDTRITDLHVWGVGKNMYSCALTAVTHDHQLTPDIMRRWLSSNGELAHSTIEIHYCPD